MATFALSDSPRSAKYLATRRFTSSVKSAPLRLAKVTRGLVIRLHYYENCEQFGGLPRGQLIDKPVGSYPESTPFASRRPDSIPVNLNRIVLRHPSFLGPQEESGVLEPPEHEPVR